jgi:hypothetical protein
MSSPAGLRAYLQAANESEIECLKEHEYFIGLFDDLDELFRRLVTGKIHGTFGAHNVLAMSAHADYLAAVGAALRGQSPATFMILRGSLESALYAYLVSVDSADGDIWLNRHKDLEASKSRFTANRAIQKLRAHDPNLADIARDGYQWMIEFGAHPNPRSILEHVRFNEAHADGDRPVSLIYIQSSDALAVIRCLSACVENACAILAVLCHASPDHPRMGETFSEIWNIWREVQRKMKADGYLAEDY